MTTAKPLLHLEQQDLSHADKATLAGLTDWLSTAKFEKQGGGEFELCVDKELPQKWELLEKMDLVKQVCHAVVSAGNQLTYA